MSEITKAAIKAELALLTTVADFPLPPFGYGADIRCDVDLDPDMLEVDGGTTLALAQAILRRLDCPRGALLDDPDYGIDLRSYVNRGMTVRDINALAGQIRSEVAKDDRVASVTVTVRPSATGSSLRIELAITPIDQALGGFDLVLSATSATVLIDEIRGAA